MDKQKLIELRGDGLSYQAIANLMGVSRQRIFQILRPWVPHGEQQRESSNGSSLYGTKAWYKQFQEAILERDKHECKLCGRKERIVTHHIDGNPFHNDASNIITLCNRCHGTSHVKHDRDKVEKRLTKLIK